MEFSFNEEELMIQDTARQFAQNQLKPNAQALDHHNDRELFLSQVKQLGELGFMGINIDSQYGGIEAGSVAFSLAITELARGCASTAVTTSVTNMVAEVIQAVGNEEQKSYYLPKICSGEFYAGAFCLTESTAGSDPSAMRTTAVRDGENYILNGSKIYITSAEYAGVFVVWAVTDKEAARGKGISCFLIDGNTDGVTVAKAEDKMGQKASATNEVSFDNCIIPATALLGEENKGFKIAVTELAGGRIGIGSLALGLGLEAMDYGKAYIKERQQFGQPLANFQGLQWMVADRYTELEAARLLLLQAASLKDDKKPFSTQASMAKVFASEKANDACYTALQLLGGAGYIKEYPVERLARDVRITSIYEGTSEIQRVVIARDLFA
ncbi:acyl-CoA dehydrogenase family protein [Psychrobium sp. 1_MG-2023]|uniref:acyl-CoA dehydrogenase family protein n=1 Tax=Psychrobium sp. 1_MG-2023 TaxID=3062624 RepID=UPI000C3495F4|nr:acyl-CoA dehydrogenase family protein [Psychrobium sp. 1_MG-2023]MDP2562924.1 acyl-CoA dehydrogenase family protein [Psychrobium sp. 1_MG-2023]PKF54712.1 acyl-CoA dehydrogenase [Alteromonadales bacterium alter-6D02]